MAIDVLLPVFNAASHLREALESIFVQSFQDWKLIAVDDGSTDGSFLILKEYARNDSRIHLVSRPNTGIVGALNDGLAKCEDEFVARMDADDICLPRRFEQQVAFLQNHPNIVAVGTDILYTDPEGSPLVRHMPATEHEGIVAQLLEGNGGALIHPSVMLRKKALDRIDGYRIACRDRYEDLDLYIRLSLLGRLANLPEVHLLYRQHLQSINRTLGAHEALRREIVNPFRAVHGLPPLHAVERDANSPESQSDWRRHWAYDAARGGQWDTARKNAKLALRAAPFDGRNWRCWRYVRKASGLGENWLSAI